MEPPLVTSTRRIKRIAPLQLGKISAFVYGIMGLIILPMMLLVTFLGSHFQQAQRTGFMALGIGFMIFIPVLYAVMGFIIGVLSAAIYNLVAKWIGGIEVEVE
jgi:hypothetical protein